MAHLPLPTAFHGKRAQGAFQGLSRGFLGASTKPFLGVSRVGGNSRARIVARVWGNQTRLCRAYGLFSTGFLCGAVFRGRLGVGSELGSCACGGEIALFLGFAGRGTPYLIL